MRPQSACRPRRVRIFSITGCQDRRNDLQVAAAVREVRHVDLESEAAVQTDLYSSYLAARTHLSNLAQLRRTGRWCEQCGVRSLSSPSRGTAGRKGERPDPSSSSAGMAGFQALASPQSFKLLRA